MFNITVFNYFYICHVNLKTVNIMLPKFLIADNSQEAPDLVYVVHTEKPQCIIQCDMDGFYSNQKIYWIDEEPLCTDDIESLMEEAEEFFETELENQEELYDEEEDN